MAEKRLCYTRDLWPATEADLLVSIARKIIEQAEWLDTDLGGEHVCIDSRIKLTHEELALVRLLRVASQPKR